MRVWRLSRERHASTAFSGEGARLFSARWNSAGIPMVYTATSLALAALEVFVHLRRSQAPDDLVVVSAELQMDEVRGEREARELIDHLPSNWRSQEQNSTRQVGDEWIASGRSPFLKVPSAVIEDEWNVLINPLHPAARDIVLSEPKPFHFDERMFRERISIH